MSRQSKRQKTIAQMKLRNIEPKTRNQDKAFMYDENGENLLMLGLPGTGKPFWHYILPCKIWKTIYMIILRL